ncbi:hypothetical protein CHRY9293_00952 [Chryseobacterium potabilaquae]|uniref:Uncharacterized protein n=1 Tax=Chryseobacterium potabilaquae TaxID=2675057 RepID=A0A6N4X5V7_9FLAO|nr:hypothetical protein CHRY9293_00952 [Chryseobacterium potabilaquae]
MRLFIIAKPLKVLQYAFVPHAENDSIIEMNH